MVGPQDVPLPLGTDSQPVAIVTSDRSDAFTGLSPPPPPPPICPLQPTPHLCCYCCIGILFILANREGHCPNRMLVTGIPT